MNKLSRRTFLSSAGAVAASAGILPAASSIRWISEMKGLGPAPADGRVLRDIAGSKGILFGAAAHSSIMKHDPQYAQLFAQQCSIMVPESELKMDKIEPTQGTYDYSGADFLVNFAQQNNIKFRGHTLVWYQSLPGWFYRNINASNAKPFITDYINTVMGRYAGKVESWDVVNEVMNPKDNRPDGLRNSPWLKFLGPDYIEMAFRTAAAADPHAHLMWNENWLEEETPEGESKRRSMVAMLKQLKSRGVPIHGIGIQSHLVGDHGSIIAGPGFQKFLQEVGDMDLRIFITELDVSDVNLPADAGTRDQTIANIYYQYLTAVLAHKSVTAVLTWGLSDKYTWLSSYEKRTDNAKVRPLPFDIYMKPKSVYDAMVRAFDEAPKR